VNQFIKDIEPVTWIGPAILGAVLGLLTYIGINPQPGSLVLVAISLVAGVVVTSLVAYSLRRFLLPRVKKDEAGL
jgi:hypothetical protein